MSRCLISVGFPAALRRSQQVYLLLIPARFLPCRCSGAPARAATWGGSVLRRPRSRALLPVLGHFSPCSGTSPRARAPLPVLGHLSLCSGSPGARGPSEVPAAPCEPQARSSRGAGGAGAAAPARGSWGRMRGWAPRERSRSAEEGRRGLPGQFAEMLL